MSDQSKNARDQEQRAVRVVVALMPPSASVEAQGHGTHADIVVNGQPIEVVWAGEGDLRHARRAMERAAGRTHVVVVGRVLSPGARALLSEHGIGWADETGAAEIAIGSVVISRTGSPARSDPGVKHWTPSVMAVTEAVLCGFKATASAMAESTGLSTGSCVNALRFLSDRGLLTAEASRGRGSGRRIADVERMVDEYARAVAEAKALAELTVGISARDIVGGVIDTGRSWDETGVEWAATGVVAASVLAPYLTTFNTAEVYVAADTAVQLEAAAVRVGLRPMKGGRLTLRPFPTIAVRRFATKTGSLRVAPWPRVYADLRTSGVRGEEAAEHLKEVVDAARVGSKPCRS